MDEIPSNRLINVSEVRGRGDSEGAVNYSWKVQERVHRKVNKNSPFTSG